MLNPEDIEEEYEVRDVRIKTAYGWADVTRVFKTKPLPVWRLTTDTHTLEASKEHLVFTEDGWRHIGDLVRGDLVIAEEGVQEVLEVCDTGRVENLYDISVNCPSHAFYSGGILSHNSTTICTRMLMNSHMLPGYQGLYVVPNEAQRKTTADRLEQMESRFAEPTGTQNLYTKKYSNGSLIYMLHCGETANDARGKSSWEIIIDEAQSMSPEIVPDILECNQMSPLPLTLYTGTAMSTETLLEQEWQKSSQGIWHIKAGDGRTWLNMHDNDTLLKVCDNPRGPTCPITGKILDVTNGHYVHAYPNRIANGYVGLHVPQVIIKDNVDTQLQWQKLYRKRQEYDPNKFLMECCGIAIAEGAREITQADLEKACSLPYTDEDILKKCRSGYYKLLVSGCDWGGSDENTAAKTKLSYTVHCVMGVAPNNMVDVLYFNRYTGMDYRSICKCIVDAHREFCCDIMSGDDGVGLAYNTEMRDYLPAMTHFITRLTMPGTAPMAPIKNSSIVNHMALNKTEIVTNVFNDLKRGRLRFREWGKMQQFLTDFLNVYRAPMDSSTGGASRFRWMRSSGKADDALMALCFGYAYVKLFLGENIVADHATQRHVMDILNGHPGRSIAPPSRDFNYII